jgi:putative ABC transport system permease protein
VNTGIAIGLAGRSLLRHRVRTALAMLGIVIGIAAVICMVALGQGASSMIQSQINSMGHNLLMIWPGAASSSGFSYGGGTAVTLTPEDGEALLKEVHSIASLTPVIRTRGQLVHDAQNWVPGSIYGVDPAFVQVRDWPVDQGEMFTDRDVASSAKVALIGKTVADNLFLGDSPLGATMRIKNIPFRVVGVLAGKGTNAMGNDQDDVVVVPWTSVANLLQGSSFRNVDQLLVSVDTAEHVPAATAEITDVLRARHRLQEGDVSDFRILSMSEMAQTGVQMQQTMSALLAGIASISLLVGGIGIMNIMRVSVTERTREIGLRLAVGARGRDILQQFLAEAAMLTGIAGMIGVGVGAGASQALAKVQSWPFELSHTAMAAAAVFSCAVGIFFGLYPALRAARLDPIEALRYE